MATTRIDNDFNYEPKIKATKNENKDIYIVKTASGARYSIKAERVANDGGTVSFYDTKGMFASFPDYMEYYLKGSIEVL